MTRLERIVYLLESIEDARSTISKRGDTIPASRYESRLLSMDAMWHEVSHTKHELSTTQLYELADQAHEADVDIHWTEDGTLAYRYWRSSSGNGA